MESLQERISRFITIYFAVFLVSFCLGIFTGTYLARQYYINKLLEATKVGGIVIENEVYVIEPKNILKK